MNAHILLEIGFIPFRSAYYLFFLIFFILFYAVFEHIWGYTFVSTLSLAYDVTWPILAHFLIYSFETESLSEPGVRLTASKPQQNPPHPTALGLQVCTHNRTYGC